MQLKSNKRDLWILSVAQEPQRLLKIYTYETKQTQTSCEPMCNIHKHLTVDVGS